MRPRTGALLAIVVGTGWVAVAASAQQQPPQRSLAARVPPPAPGQSRPLAIDWNAVDQQAKAGVNIRSQNLHARFVAANKAEIDKIAVPVLLPTDPDLMAGLRIFANGPFYSASSSPTGMSFLVQGSGRAFALAPATARALPRAGIASRIPPDGIVIEQTEAGVDASFTRFGASYSVSLECAKAHADKRCADGTYVKGVIARMMVIKPGSAP